jgi:hypothetical protein
LPSTIPLTALSNQSPSIAEDKTARLKNPLAVSAARALLPFSATEVAFQSKALLYVMEATAAAHALRIASPLSATWCGVLTQLAPSLAVALGGASDAGQTPQVATPRSLLPAPFQPHFQWTAGARGLPQPLRPGSMPLGQSQAIGILARHAVPHVYGQSWPRLPSASSLMLSIYLQQQQKENQGGGQRVQLQRQTRGLQTLPQGLDKLALAQTVLGQVSC